jgi:hypothetical protein
VDEHGNLSDMRNWISGLLIQMFYSQTRVRAPWGRTQPIHDRKPILIILYADRHYTHAINISYLTGQQRRQLKAQIRFWYYIDPRLKYYYLKTHNTSILPAYRTYFTHLLHPVSAWELPELEGTIPEAYALLGKIQGVPTDWGKFSTRIVAAARARDIGMNTRPSQRPNQQPARSRPSARPLMVRVQEAVRRLDRQVASGTVRPPSTRPRSQRPGS